MIFHRVNILTNNELSPSVLDTEQFRMYVAQYMVILIIVC